MGRAWAATPAALARRLAAACLALGAMAVAAPAAAQAPTSEVALPTAADALAAARAAGDVIPRFPVRGTRVPAGIEDRETVGVAINLQGKPTAIRVVQRMTLRGLGDYFFQVPGPATGAKALADSRSSPGLLDGDVVWQGFASGETTLAAAVDLSLEAVARLPIQIQLESAVNSTPLARGRRLSGPLSLRLVVTNATSIPVSVAGGAGDPVELAPVLDWIRSDLLNGRRPRPGLGAVPRGLRVAGPVERRRERIEAPFRIRGTLSFPIGTVRRPVVVGAEAIRRGGILSVPFSALLGGGHPLRMEILVVGDAASLGAPSLELTATPSVPALDQVQPPSWQQAVRQDPATFDGTAMLRRVMSVLWRVARLRQFDAFLGNPDPQGPASSVYRFRLTLAPARSAAEPPGGLSVLGAVGLSLAGLLVLYALALVWARS